MKGDYGPDRSSLPQLAFWTLSGGALRSFLDCRPERFRQQLLMASSVLGCMVTDDWEKTVCGHNPHVEPRAPVRNRAAWRGAVPSSGYGGSYTTQGQQAKGESSVCAWSGVGHCRFAVYPGLSSQLCCKLFKSKLIFLYLFLASDIGRCDYLLSNE